MAGQGIEIEMKKPEDGISDAGHNEQFIERKVMERESGNLEDCPMCPFYVAEIHELTAQLAQTVLFSSATGVTGTTNTNEGEEDKGHLKRFEVKGQEALTPDQTVMSNSALLQKIFENLDEDFILPLRLVCQKWEKEATAALLNSNSKCPEKFGCQNLKVGRTTVHLSFNPKKNVMGRNDLGTIKKLTKLIAKGKEAGRQFPCSRFVIICPNLLVCSQMTQFLVDHGHLIQSLTLKFISLAVKVKKDSNPGDRSPIPPLPPPTYEMAVESLRNLFFKWAVNIKYLILENIPWPENYKVRLLDGEFPLGSATLPNLKILYLRQCSWSYSLRNIMRIPGRNNQTIVRDILLCAPNLEEVKDYPLDFKTFLLATNKMCTIKSANFSLGHSYNYDPDRNMGQLEFIAKSYQHLEEIRFDLGPHELGQNPVAEYPEGWRMQVERLNQILENNKGTVKKLTIPQLAVLPGLRIPIMPAVKILDIWFDYDDFFTLIPGMPQDLYLRVFPKELDLDKTFPKLSRLNLEFFYDALQNMTAVLPRPELTAASPLTSVKTLQIYFECSRADELMSQLSILTTNVKFLIVSHSDFRRLPPRVSAHSSRENEGEPLFPQVFRAVWKYFPRIERLQLRFYSSYLKDMKENIFYRNKFSSMVDSVITGIDIETVKKLRKRGTTKTPDLGLGLGEKVRRDEPSILDMKNLKFFSLSMDTLPVFSFISATHGFNLVQNLRVVVKPIEGRETRDDCLDDPHNLMAECVQFIRKPWRDLRS